MGSIGSFRVLFSGCSSFTDTNSHAEVCQNGQHLSLCKENWYPSGTQPLCWVSPCELHTKGALNICMRLWTWSSCKCLCSFRRSWTRWSLKVLSNSKNSMILCKLQQIESKITIFDRPNSLLQYAFLQHNPPPLAVHFHQYASCAHKNLCQWRWTTVSQLLLQHHC